MGCASARPSRQRDGAAGHPRGDSKEKSPGPKDEGFGGVTVIGLASGTQSNKYLITSAAIRTDQVANTTNWRSLISALI